MLRDDVLEKLAKLKAHEESARKIGSLMEAEAFAEKIQDLLLRYRVEMVEVELQQREGEDPIEGRVVTPDPGMERRSGAYWEVVLANTVARTHGCRVLSSVGSNAFLIVGRKVERQTAAYLLTYLVRTLHELCDIGYREARKAHAQRGTRSGMQGWRQSFYRGAGIKLCRRLEDREAQAAKTTGESAWGLVKAEMARVDAATRKLSSGTVRRRKLPRAPSESGFLSGVKAGETVRLDHGGKRIGEPRRRIR